MSHPADPPNVKSEKLPQKKSKRNFSRLWLTFITCAVIIPMAYLFWGKDHEKVVNVYCWYGVLPKEVLVEFTKETGIHVRLDLFDNNDMVETKFLAGNSGYDVALPTVTPYIARQIKAGALEKINKDKISNFKNLDPHILEQSRIADPHLDFCIPYTWGTFGFCYNVDMIQKRMPTAPVNSYGMLFDPDVVKNFKECGVTLLEEPTDIYPQVMMYMGIHPQSSQDEDLEKAHNKLLNIRPYIARLSTSRSIAELVSGETCLAQVWSGNIEEGIREAKNLGRNIRYVIPEEGSGLWVDALVIPKNAPNISHAHAFIDYLLRPEVAAKVSLNCFLLTTINESKKHLPKGFLKNPSLDISPDTMKKLTLDKEQTTEYERDRNRLFTNFRINRKV